MFVSVLGPVRIVEGGEGQPIRSARRRHLLAALSASVGATVSTDRLTEAIWGEQPPASATAALQVHMSDLRSQLDPQRPARQDGGHVTTEPEGYRLELRPGQLDWTRAVALAEAGRGLRAAGRHEDARAALAEALRRWEPSAYADAREAVGAHAQWLDGVRLDVEDDLLASSLAAGHADEVAADAARLADEEPFRERRAALLVLAHYRCGRQREALEAVEATRARLRDEVGCEMGPELTALQRGILDHDPALASLTLSPPPSAVSRPTVSGADRLTLSGDQVALAVAESVLWASARVVDRSAGSVTFEGDGDAMTQALADEREHPGTPVGDLVGADRGTSRPRPPPASDLIGRDDEVAAVRAALDHHHVVSVVGPPGVGTSAVALAATADRPTHRVTPSLAEGNDLVAALADAVGIRRPSRSDERLLAAVDGAVVLIDGADVEPEQAVDLVERLGTAPAAVLATGRRRLGLAREEVVTVEPLEPDAAATLLARLAGPAVRSEPAVDDLLERLGGIPLAIELIAPSVRTLGADAVRDRLDAGPGLWQSGLAGGPDLRDAIGWSHDQLDEDAAALLARASVFAGPFTLDDVEAAAASPDLPADRVAPALAALVDASLVAPRRDVDGLTYELYAVVRAFALEQLRASGEEAEARRRHAAHVARSLARSGRATGRPGVAAAQRRIQRSRRDLDLAVVWLEEAGEPDDHLSLAEDLTMYWFSTGRLREGRAFTERALARGGSGRRRAGCLTTAAFLAWFQGDYVEVAERLAEATAGDGDRPPSTLRLVVGGALALVSGDVAGADRDSQEALERARAGRSASDLAVAATMAGTATWYLGRYAEAVDHFREACEIGSREGFPLLTALARRGQALNLASIGALDEARAVAAQARQEGEVLGDAVNVGQAVAFVGLVELAAGRDDEAERLLREAVATSAGALELFGLFLEVSGLLVLAGRRGDHELVLALDAWISATVEELGMPLPPTHQEERHRAVAAAEAALDPTAVAAARHRGRSCPPQDLAHTVLGP